MLTSRSVYSSIVIIEQCVKISKIVGFYMFLEYVHSRELCRYFYTFIVAVLLMQGCGSDIGPGRPTPCKSIISI